MRNARNGKNIMTRLLPVSLALAATAQLLSVSVLGHEFPALSGKDLNEKPWTTPAGFPAARTLVVAAFEREQQMGVDTWIDGLDLKSARAKIPWIEMPVIDDPGIFMRWFIDTGMQRGIPDAATRAHVWTAYTSRQAFLQACGLASAEKVYALVVDQKGRILAVEPGNFTKEGAERLHGALRLSAR